MRELKSYREVENYTIADIGNHIKDSKDYQIVSATVKGIEKDRHPIYITEMKGKQDQYTIPVMYVEDIYDYYQETKSLDGAVKYFAARFDDAKKVKSQQDLQDLAMLLCRDPLLYRRNVVAFFVRQDDPSLAQRDHINMGDLSLVYFISMERFGASGAVPVNENTKRVMPFAKSPEELLPMAIENREDIDPMVIRDYSKDYQHLAAGITVYQVTTKEKAHGSISILYKQTQDFLSEKMGEGYYVIPISTEYCLAVKLPAIADISQIAEKLCLEEEKNGGIPDAKKLTHSVYRVENGLIELI